MDWVTKKGKEHIEVAVFNKAHKDATNLDNMERQMKYHNRRHNSGMQLMGGLKFGGLRFSDPELN